MYVDYNAINKISLGYSDTIERLEKEFDYIKKFLEDYDNLSDKEKYEVLTHFLYLRFNSNDIIKLINIKTGLKYTRLIDIPTKEEGECVDVWWKEKRKTVLSCATFDGFWLTHLTYSYSEIMELIKHGTIYPISNYGMIIENYSDDRENHPLIETFEDGEIITQEDKYAEWDNKLKITPKETGYPLMVKLIETSISKERLFTFVKRFFKDIIDNLEADPKYHFCTREEGALSFEMSSYYVNHFKNKRLIKK